MENQEIIDLFKEEGPKVWADTLDIDCLIVNAKDKNYRIDRPTKRAYREHFYEIQDCEAILFARDTSFWNSKNQGCVITNQKLHIIFNNKVSDSYGSTRWKDIEAVKICDGKFCFYFYFDDEPLCLEPKLFLKQNSSNPKFQKRIADFLNKIAQVALNPIADAIQKLDSEDTPEDEKIAIAKNMIGRDPDYDGVFEYFLGLCAYEKGDTDEALGFLTNALKRDTLGDEARTKSKLVISEIELNSEDNYSLHTKERLLDVIRDKSMASEMFDDHITISGKAAELLKKYDENRIANIDSIPYHLRKILAPVKSYKSSKKSRSLLNTLVSLDTLLTSDLSFPSGHPVEGNIYIAHPVIPKRYIPIDNNELFITEEKLREFCYLVQCMGATKISITSSYSIANESTNRAETSTRGKVSLVHIDIELGANQITTNKQIDWLNHLMQFSQEFNPKTKPFIPDNIVWLQHETSWQSLVKQRMTGSLIKHHEHIDLKQSRLIQTNEIKELLGSFSRASISVDANLKRYSESTTNFTENTSLDIEVSFWPVDANGDLLSPEEVENNRPINKLIRNYNNPVYMANLSAPDNVEDLIEMLHFLQGKKEFKNHHKRLYNEGEQIFGDDPAALEKIKVFKPRNIFGF